MSLHNHCTCIDQLADLVVLDVLSCGDDFLLKVAGRNQIRAFTADMRRYFEQQRVVVLGKMPPERSYVPYTKAPGDQWLFPEAEWNDKLAKVGEPYITQSIETSGIATMFDLNPELTFNPRSIAMQQYVNKHKFKFSFNVNQETMKQLRREFAAGIDAGEGIRKLRKRVEKVFDIAEKFRSERIARSEIVRASSAAAEEAYKQSGVVEGKEWVANPDACIWCSSMHGTTMGLGGNYFAQGEQLEVDGSVMHFDYSDITYPPLHPNCYSDDTEVYTEAGWMGIPLVLKGTQVLTLEPEAKNLEWGKVVETVSYEVDEMVSLTNKQGSFDMLVTPDHPFFGYKRVDRGKQGRYPEPITIVGIEGLIGDFRFYTSSRWKGNEPNDIDVNGITLDTEDYCRFMGYYLSEGHTRQRDSGRYQISVAQEKHRMEMWENIEPLPFRKVWLGKKQIWIADNALGEYLIKFGKSAEKYIPDEIRELSPHYIRIFLDAFLLGDGNVKKSKKWKGGNFVDTKSYFTASKQMADVLGELIIKTGGSVGYRLMAVKGKQQKFKNGTYTLNHDVWRVNELTSQYKMFRNIITGTISYPHGTMVYDLEVDRNHTILTRRNGRVVWGSNCKCTLIPIVRGT